MRITNILLGGLTLTMAGAVKSQEILSPEIRQILPQLGTRCRQDASISYRSATLADPQNRLQVFVSGNLLRRPQWQSKSTGEGCFPSKVDTTQVTLHLLSSPGYERVIPLYRHRSTLGFNYLQPLAFSADGRYLILQVQSSNGIDLTSEIEVLDRYKAWLPIHVDYCEGSTFGESFTGFTAKYRILLQCLSGENNDRELWNLDRQAGQKTPEVSLVVQQYGTILQPLQVFR